nr:hypothetical protein [Streptomyces sp. DSM 41633]
MGFVLWWEELHRPPTELALELPLDAQRGQRRWPVAFQGFFPPFKVGV